MPQPPQPIRHIAPDDLTPESLRNRLYPDLDQELYWSESWDPDFYVSLAEAGFISISIDHPDRGPVFIAELQAEYAVLDWGNLHTSRHLARLLRSGRLEQDEIELRVNDDPSTVIERVLEHHSGMTWMSPPYVALLRRLPSADGNGFALRGVELWSRKHDLLVAGELGYTLGRTYTSLSGFHTRDTEHDRTWRHFGTLQIRLLAERLRERGYAFWNMGHPHQPYKTAIGAKITPRATFLERWLPAQGTRTGRSLF